MVKPDCRVDLYDIFCLFCGKLCWTAQKISGNEGKIVGTVFVWMWVSGVVFLRGGSGCGAFGVMKEYIA